MTLATVRMPAVADGLTIVGEVEERYASSRRDTTSNNRGASNHKVTKNSKEAFNWLVVTARTVAKADMLAAVAGRWIP